MLSKISSGAACVAGFKTLYDLFAQVLFCMGLCISENLTVCLRKKLTPSTTVRSIQDLISSLPWWETSNRQISARNNWNSFPMQCGTSIPVHCALESSNCDRQYPPTQANWTQYGIFQLCSACGILTLTEQPFTLQVMLLSFISTLRLYKVYLLWVNRGTVGWLYPDKGQKAHQLFLLFIPYVLLTLDMI